ncbi:MAG: hypothetical protein GX833_02285 [Clostridium sp.]|jgi:hypothetical protein|nr:hypothetical protein [Clostridium sp.]
MGQTKNKGFISASCLVLLFVCLATTVSLGRGLSAAITLSLEDLDQIKGQLAFEENMIRLSQGKTFKPFSQGSFGVILTNKEDGTLLQLINGQMIEEELWIEKGAL